MVKNNKKKKFARSVNYDSWLIKRLKDHNLAVAYLNGALEEVKKGENDSLDLLLMALKNVIKAQGGFTKISKKAGLGRESLYKTVSKEGNPEFRTINSLTNALGLDLRFVK